MNPATILSDGSLLRIQNTLQPASCLTKDHYPVGTPMPASHALAVPEGAVCSDFVTRFFKIDKNVDFGTP
jgi:hypothetical protein